LIPRKITKVVATGCQILGPKCTKCDFGWGSVPDPVGEAYSALQTLSCILGPTSKRTQGREMKGRGEKGSGMRSKGERGKRRGQGK